MGNDAKKVKRPSIPSFRKEELSITPPFAKGGPGGISRKEAGIAYAAILFLMVILSALSLGFLQKAGIETSATVTRGDGMQAHYLAESAANHAMWRLLNESDFPSSTTSYTMHSLAGGSYGYKVRRHTDTTFGTVATVGVVGDNVVHQSYVLYVVSACYAPGWGYRQKITISPTVSDADLTDFPYMVKIDDAANPLFANALANGDDIVFTASDGKTKLSHEIEKYDSSAGNEELVAWVKIPDLSSSDPTEIYMVYGNAAASNQEEAEDVWSNGYEAVYHLHDDFDDSLTNHDGSNTDSFNMGGQIADAQGFYPDNGVDEIDLGFWSVSGDQLTIQAWMQVYGNFPQNDPRVISKADDTGEQDHIWMMSLYNGSINENRLRFRLKTGTSDSAGTTTLLGTNPNGYLPNQNDWYLVAMTYDGSLMRIIRDGLDAGSAAKNGNLRERNWDISIGNNPGESDEDAYSWRGRIDEVRISTVARTIDWMMAEYRNQGSPDAYQTIGEEQNCDSSVETILEAHFDSDEEGFTYTDDAFRGTTQPVYASGNYEAAGGYNGGGLRVLAGGINDDDILDMSGGWQQTFNLAADADVIVSFRYQLTLTSEYEADEYGQALLSVDGTLYGEGANDYVYQIAGDGNGGSPDTSGWRLFQTDPISLSTGNHTLIFGGYNNKKTFNDESVEVLIDDVMVVK